MTGCSCASTLAERGARVRLYEAREIAGGASGRNGGFALRGGALPYDEARRRMGAENARALWQLTERTLDRFEALAGDAFRRVGSLRVAVDAAETERVGAELEALREDGFDADWASPPAGFAAAVLNPPDGSIQPARWVRGLAARAAEAGAEIVEGAPIDAGELAELPTTAVVLATDGLTAVLAPELDGQVWPVRGQVLVTAPLATRLFDRPHYARDGFDYWQQLADGRLLVGGRRDVGGVSEDTAVEQTTQPIQLELEALAAQLAGAPVEITHRWSGIWGETADRLPFVGRLRDGVWVAAGYSGHGNVLGLACGELVARAVLGEPPPELDLFAPRE